MPSHRQHRASSISVIISWLGSHSWIVYTLVLFVAAAIRFYDLGQPTTLVFDEVYYVRDAAAQMVFGYPTQWPEDLEYAFGPDELARMGDQASFAVHPPLGKWLIAIGLALFGADNGWGWRFSAALFGTGTVALLMVLTNRLTRSMWVTALAGGLLAIEGVSAVMSRVSLLDGFLAFFALAGVLFVVLDHEWVLSRLSDTSVAAKRVLWWRPWLLAAALAFGCAASVKWSGFYFVAIFGVFIVIRDAVVRKRLARLHWMRDTALLQTPVTLLLTLPVVIATYLASWAGWIFTAAGWNRQWSEAFQKTGIEALLPDWLHNLWQYHVAMYTWHSTLQAPHPYLAHPLTWPLAIRPTSMFFESAKLGEKGCAFSECAWAITPIPNVLIWWGGIAALVWLTVLVVRRALGKRTLLTAPHSPLFGRAAAFTLVAFAAGYLPWLVTFGRTAVFQFYTVVFAPYVVLALALALWQLIVVGNTKDAQTAQSRRRVVTVFLIAAVLLSAFFLPLWLGTQTPMWFWNIHMWMPSWR